MNINQVWDQAQCEVWYQVTTQACIETRVQVTSLVLRQLWNQAQEQILTELLKSVR
jgi:hypothetical protein